MVLHSSVSSMSDVDLLAHTVVMPVLLSIGFVNQCLNLCTLFNLPSGTFPYLKASAIADLLSIISLIPFILRHANLTDTSSRFTMWYHAHCELYFVNSLISASALCIVAMTADRFFSVCYPLLRFRSIESRSKPFRVIGLLFAAAFIVYFPSCWQKEIKLDGSQTPRQEWLVVGNNDLEKSLTFNIYLIFRELFCRWGPVVILVILNTAIIRSLNQRQNCTVRRTLRHRPNDRHRTCSLLLVTSTTFVLANLPASVLSLLFSFVFHHNHPNTASWHLFRAFANLLQVTSYLYNFYLYALCSSEYRAAFMRLLSFSCSAKNDSSNRVNSESPSPNKRDFRKESYPFACTGADV